MKLFLSWSGLKSQKTAIAFKDWLQLVIQSVDPWISTDIDKGARWSSEISVALENTKMGIICLNKENLNENWILFEAGALSKTKDAYICCFLLDVSPSEILGPLEQFQHTKNNKEDIFKLLQTINSGLAKADGKPLDEKILNEVFESWYPRLETELKNIIDTNTDETKANNQRDERDMLEEVLDIVRTMRNRSNNMYTTMEAFE